jgi:hypothetical protein
MAPLRRRFSPLPLIIAFIIFAERHADVSLFSLRFTPFTLADFRRHIYATPPLRFSSAAADAAIAIIFRDELAFRYAILC